MFLKNERSHDSWVSLRFGSLTSPVAPDCLLGTLGCPSLYPSFPTLLTWSCFHPAIQAYFRLSPACFISYLG